MGSPRNAGRSQRKVISEKVGAVPQSEEMAAALPSVFYPEAEWPLPFGVFDGHDQKARCTAREWDSLLL